MVKKFSRSFRVPEISDEDAFTGNPVDHPDAEYTEMGSPGSRH